MLWFLGYPDQAREKGQEALVLAQKLSHPFSLAFALNWLTILHHFFRDAQAVRNQAEVLMDFTREHGFTQYLMTATIHRGWSLTQTDQLEEGIEQMRQGIEGRERIGAKLGRPSQLAQLAEAYASEAQVGTGLALLAEAKTKMNATEERWCEAEIYRTKGELLLQQSSSDSATEAEPCFHRAITVAQNQSAKSWELRAATSLAKLWHSQGKREEARELLEPVYGWFTEGFDTADLIDAKVFLDELSEVQS